MLLLIPKILYLSEIQCDRHYIIRLFGCKNVSFQQLTIIMVISHKSARQSGE